PLLSAKDVETPVRGERYDQLLASVDERVLAGPITGIRVWAQDGTILFADERGMVGERDGKMREDLLAAVAGRSQSVVEDGEFRTLTSMRVGEPPSLVMAELIRSHDAIVEESREQWYPWVGRALTAAAILAVLWVVTAIAIWVLGIVRAREAERRRAEPIAPPVVPGRPAHDDDVPPYMRPGFREEVEARRRTEIEGIAADT
ncbi:MAG TPA: hypothetical protein VFT27_14335, partial [Actinomycetota bacterium]|nr:hypothetical protein [Actinomycetota bacterium]